MLELALGSESLPPGLLVNAAMVLHVAGFAIGGRVLLRGLTLLGTGFYVAYYAVVADAPLWDAILASLAIGAANLIGLLRERRAGLRARPPLVAAGARSA